MESKDYQKSNYKIAYNSEWEKLKKKDPNDIADRLGCFWDSKNQIMMVRYFNQDYSISWNDELIVSTDLEGKAPDIMSAIIILNYLTFSSEGTMKASTFSSLKELPNGGALFYPAFYKATLLPMIKQYGYDASKLISSGMKIGGIVEKEGDASIVIQALPFVQLKIIIWEGDEEFTPNGTLLFSNTVSQLLHIESIIGLGMEFERILRTINNEQKIWI